MEIKFYEFDDFRFEPTAHRLYRNGLPVELEPKAFALLLEFVQRPQALLTRDQLLEAVWGHQHVTSAALSRLVTLLRRALGDDSDNPRYIHTVHGLGYRFGVMPLSAPIQEPHVDLAISKSQSELASAVPRRRSRDIRSSHVWMWAAVMAILLATAFIAFLPRSNRSDVVRSPIIAVLPFTTRSENGDMRAAAEGLSDSLADAFARLTNLSVAGRESLRALGRGQVDPQRVANMLDADYVLDGEIIAEGELVRSHVDLWRRGEIVPLWVDEQTSPREQLFRVVVPLMERVRATLVPNSKSIMPAPIIAVPAQDLYWLGRHYWYQRTPESLARALGYFQQAIADNPKYAQAYCGIADAYMLLNEYGDLSLDDASVKARAAVARAKELAPDLADAYASEGLILMGELHYAQAVGVFEHALKLFARHPDASIWYGTALSYSGRPRDALSWHRVIEERDPLNPILQTYLGVDSLLAGDHVQASRKFERAIELNSDYAEPHWQVGLQQQLFGHVADSVKTFRAAQDLRGTNGSAAFYLAYSYLALDDGESALAALRDARDLSPIDRIEAELWSLSSSGHLDVAQRSLDAIRPGPATQLWYLALNARLSLLRGDEEGARQRYDAVFAGALEGGDPFLRLWLPDFGLGHFSTWISLLPEGSPKRAAAMHAYRTQIDRLVAGGVQLPELNYQLAQIAALEGNAEQAAAQLELAQNAGWLRAGALERDRPWLGYAQTEWLIRARSRQATRLSEERAAIATMRMPLKAIADDAR
ncbi:MAG: winged helix-turn-helix domain-containing protein [Rudaea sp.]